MWIRQLLAVALFGFVLATNRPAPATVVRAIGLDEIVVHSEAVVVGRVLRVQSGVVELHGHRRWITDATVLIDHVVQARARSSVPQSQEIVVRTLGGAAEGIVQTVLGAAVLAPNETVLLFLRRGSDGKFWVCSMAQGEFVVRTALGSTELRPSAGLDVVLDRHRSVVTMLAGKSLEQAEASIIASAGKARCRK